MVQKSSISHDIESIKTKQKHIYVPNSVVEATNISAQGLPLEHYKKKKKEKNG